MSRIHEALKKIERTRAERDGNPNHDSMVEEPRQARPSVVGKGIANENFPEVLAEHEPGTASNLLASCEQRDWKPDSKMLFLGEHPASSGSEEFRTLRSSLYRMREQRQLRKILVTSPLPNEGKSFVAANVAQVIACQEGQRALLIDADLRGGRLHKMLGTTSTPGLSEYLLNDIDEFALMQRGRMQNLFFIPAGMTVPNPAELVANGRLRTLLDRSETIFDWIIIDSPPAIPVSDARLLADYCDGVLMVVRSNVTDSEAARRAWHQFRETQLVGTVLNGVEPSSLAYGSYGRT